MSPLQVSLLLRFYSMPRPNYSLREEQAYAPAMKDAIENFRKLGLVKDFVNAYVARHGMTVAHETYTLLLTEKGKALAEQMLSACDKLYRKVPLDADQPA